MNRHFALRAAVALASLASLLPICAHSAEAGHNQTANAQASMSDEELAKVSERIRQTGAQMRADIKEARARLEAQEAERKREEERTRQQAIKEAKQRQAQEAAQARARQEAAAREQAERLKQQQAEKTAEREKQLALLSQPTKEQKAAEALRKARESAGVKAFAEEDQAAKQQAAREKAAEALRKARESTGLRAFAEDTGR